VVAERRRGFEPRRTTAARVSSPTNKLRGACPVGPEGTLATGEVGLGVALGVPVAVQVGVDSSPGVSVEVGVSVGIEVTA
jgi:hypothetical protein